MAAIETYLKEQRTAAVANLVINNTLRQLKERSAVLTKYVPLIEKDGRDWLAYIGQTVDPIASLVSTGAQYPSTRKGEFSRIQARNYKAAIQFEWDEDTQWRMQELNEFAKLRQITIQNIQVENGKTVIGQDNELAKVIFGTLASLVRGHINLIDYLAWQVLQTGAMKYNDLRTGLNIDLDWKKAIELRKNHFPTPVYQTPAGVETVDTLKRAWTALDTCDPIQDLVDMHRIYQYTNGFPADEIAISQELLLTFLRATSVKEAVVSAQVIGSVIVGTPSIEQVNDVMRRRFLPPFTVVQDQVELGDANGATVPTRLLDMNRVVFLSKQMQAQRILGGTLENGRKAGIYTRTYQKSMEPPLDITATASMQIVAAPTIGKTGMSRIVCKQPDLDLVTNVADFEFV
jgi:hypothetical protein